MVLLWLLQLPQSDHFLVERICHKARILIDSVWANSAAVPASRPHVINVGLLVWFGFEDQ